LEHLLSEHLNIVARGPGAHAAALGLMAGFALGWEEMDRTIENAQRMGQRLGLPPGKVLADLGRADALQVPYVAHAHALAAEGITLDDLGAGQALDDVTTALRRQPLYAIAELLPTVMGTLGRPLRTAEELVNETFGPDSDLSPEDVTIVNTQRKSLPAVIIGDPAGGALPRFLAFDVAGDPNHTIYLDTADGSEIHCVQVDGANPELEAVQAAIQAAPEPEDAEPCYQADDFRGLRRRVLRERLAQANNEALEAENALCQALDAIYPLAVYLVGNLPHLLDEYPEDTAMELAIRMIERQKEDLRTLGEVNRRLCDQVDEEARQRARVETRIAEVAAKVDLAEASNRELREENTTLREQVRVLKNQVQVLHESADPETRTLFCLPNPADAGPIGWKRAAERWEEAHGRADTTLRQQDRELNDLRGSVASMRERLADQGCELAESRRANDRQRAMLESRRADLAHWQGKALKLFGQAGGYRTQMRFLAAGIEQTAVVVEKMLARRQGGPNSKPHYRDLIAELRDVFAPVQAAASTYAMVDRPVETGGDYIPHDPAEISAANPPNFRYHRKDAGAPHLLLDALDVKAAHEATTEALAPAGSATD
jgi:hypothetical protein